MTPAIECQLILAIYTSIDLEATCRSPFGRHVDWYMIDTWPTTLPFEEGYCEEHITDIPLIYHWQTTDMLQTADHKVRIHMLTAIERVVIASIDRHSIECQRKFKVCWPRCRLCVNWGSTEMSIVGWSRCWSLVLIDTWSRVSIVHMIREGKYLPLSLTLRWIIVLAYTTQAE